MHRTGAPPGPDLIRCERKERGKQAQQHVEGEGKRGARRSDGLRRELLGAAIGLRGSTTVGAVLDQFEVVIAERPEEALGDLERAGVIEVLKRCRGGVHHTGKIGQQSAVDRLGHGAGVKDDAGAVAARREGELAGVEHLDGQASADLHLPDLEGGIRTKARRGSPVPHRIGAVLHQQVHRRDHVALGLAHLLAVRVQDPARDGGVLPRQGIRLEVATHHGGEQPGADDVLPLGAHVHREHALEQVGIV